jgi:hypothetical protein
LTKKKCVLNLYNICSTTPFAQTAWEIENRVPIARMHLPSCAHASSALYALLRQSATEAVPTKGMAPDQLRGPVVTLREGYAGGGG